MDNDDKVIKELETLDQDLKRIEEKKVLDEKVKEAVTKAETSVKAQAEAKEKIRPPSIGNTENDMGEISLPFKFPKSAEIRVNNLSEIPKTVIPEHPKEIRVSNLGDIPQTVIPDSVSVSNLGEIPFPKFPDHIGIRKPAWLPLLFTPLRPIKDVLDEISLKLELKPQEKIKFPTKDKDAIAVRVINPQSGGVSGGYMMSGSSPSFKKANSEVTQALIDDDRHVQVDVLTLPSVTISAEDIEIGAVEIKNSTDDTRATVGANGLYADIRNIQAGTNLIGKVGIDQVTANANEVVVKSGTVTTVSTVTNLSQLAGAAVPIGAGVEATAVRVTLPTDGTGKIATLTTLTGGGVASHAADSGNPLKTGGKYNATPPTLDDGDRGDTQVDVNGNAQDNLATYIAGEDLVNNKLVVEQRNSYSVVGTAPIVADVQLKAGAGFLHTITISQGDVAPTAGTITIYDSLTEAGAVIFQEYITTGVFSAHTVIRDCTFQTGLYVGFNGPADVNVACDFR